MPIFCRWTPSGEYLSSLTPSLLISAGAMSMHCPRGPKVSLIIWLSRRRSLSLLSESLGRGMIVQTLQLGGSVQPALAFRLCISCTMDWRCRRTSSAFCPLLMTVIAAKINNDITYVASSVWTRSHGLSQDRHLKARLAVLGTTGCMNASGR